MNEKRARGCLIAAVIWCVLLALLGVAYRFLVHPHLAGRLREATSGTSQYREDVVLALDSFSGYCLLRSESLRQELKDRQIKLTVMDDQADTAARIQALREGKVQLAVFTIDSLVTAGAKLGSFPATIILILDETQGGDALVAYRSALENVQALNDPSARIVLTPNSPSEFLARVVLAHFNLPRLPEQWWIPADGAEAVLQSFRSASPNEKKAFALWEPYVARALEQPGAHVLLDSSKLQGYIVDVLVARREFLQDRPEVVKAFVEAYTRAAWRYAQEPDGMVQLVLADAREAGGAALTEAQARKVVQGIRWKNLLENYAHFGLSPRPPGQPSIEDMIGNIVDVLLKTKALTVDPLDGRHNTLFFEPILADLRSSSFHPAQGLNVIPGLGPDSAAATTQASPVPQALTPAQWTSLRPVGELKTAPIQFRRGSAEISLDSQRDLQALARRLQGFPQFYVRVVGQARAEGDPEANRALAQARAEAAFRALTGQGLAAERVRAETARLDSRDPEAQSVSFIVGQLPY